jgi:GH35 family endo-1,4-beta-xylanase
MAIRQAASFFMCLALGAAAQDVVQMIGLKPDASAVEYQSKNVTVGQAFEVRAPVYVTQLGYFDEGGDGLVKAQQVRLYHLPEQVLVASLDIDPKAAVLSKGYRFSALPRAIQLPPSEYAVVADFSEGSDRYAAQAPLADFVNGGGAVKNLKRALYGYDKGCPDNAVANASGVEVHMTGPSLMFTKTAPADSATFKLPALGDPVKALWADPAVEARIAQGIRKNRMGEFAVTFTGADGKPLENVEVKAELVRHAFLFGCNGFMVKGFTNAVEDAKYEEMFLGLFNQITIPYYWPGIEPEQGKLRFGKDSEYMYRRPPPDTVIEFADKHGLTKKGHPLVWSNNRWAIPQWLPQDQDARTKLFEKRIEQICARYGSQVKLWDIVNEVTDHDVKEVMPKDYCFWTFKLAKKLFPADVAFTLNFTSGIWWRDRLEYGVDYLMAQNMILRGAKVDVIGMQYHLFDDADLRQALAGKGYTPEQLFRIMDRFAVFGKPFHVTEITVPAYKNVTPDADAWQGYLARQYYRAWFSHPNMACITWWNLVDGTAAGGEDRCRGGLLNRDFTRKPAYDALDTLINHEWKTRATLKPVSGKAQLDGFFGTYRFTVAKDGKTFTKDVLLDTSSPRALNVAF